MANYIGQSLGRYHILEHASTSFSTSLGEGSMASVYKAYDKRLASEVAGDGPLRTHDRQPESAPGAHTKEHHVCF